MKKILIIMMTLAVLTGCESAEHIKNKMNDIELWVETSKDFYYSVRKGEELSSNFKSGSFWIDGDISNLHITITDKRIK